MKGGWWIETTNQLRILWMDPYTWGWWVSNGKHFGDWKPQTSLFGKITGGSLRSWESTPWYQDAAPAAHVQRRLLFGGTDRDHNDGSWGVQQSVNVNDDWDTNSETHVRTQKSIVDTTSGFQWAFVVRLTWVDTRRYCLRLQVWSPVAILARRCIQLDATLLVCLKHGKWAKMKQVS